MSLFHHHVYMESKDGTTYCVGCGKAGECAHIFENVKEIKVSDNPTGAAWHRYVLRCTKCGVMKNHNSID